MGVGDGKDRVRIQLGGDEVRLAESYEVKIGVLEQPCAFSIRLGHSDVIQTLCKRYPSRTPFKLLIGDVPQFQGTTDGWTADEGGGTELNIRGRDDLKRLTDDDVAEAVSLTDVTYPGLTKHILGKVGLDTRILQTSNAANRRIRSGVHVLVKIEPRTLDEIIANPSIGGTTINYVQGHVGESYWQMLTSKLKVAGLFLWQDSDGNFVLSQPAGQQNPTYRILRWRGKNPNAVNAERSHLKNETTRRHSEVVIYSRAGGKKYGRGTVKGRFSDPEMIALGYTNKRVIRDKHVQSDADGEFLARRTLAEERRDGFELVYDVAGHIAPALYGGYAVWTPDTIVEVQDDEYGLSDLFYLEGCTYRNDANDGASTQLHLMRVNDLIFGADE